MSGLVGALWLVWVGGGLGPVEPGPGPGACAAPAPPPAVRMASGVRVVGAPPGAPRSGSEGGRPPLDTPGGPCFLPGPRSPLEELP